MTVQTCTAPVYIPQKIFDEGTKQYLHVVDGQRQVFDTKKAYRRALSLESGGEWIEEKAGKKRYFIDGSGWFQTSYKQVSKEEFSKRGDPSPSLQKARSVGLGSLAILQQLPSAFVASRFYTNQVLAQPVGTEFQVNSNASVNWPPILSKMENGSFFVSWIGNGQFNDAYFAQKYFLNGSKASSELLLVNGSGQDLYMLEDGSYIVQTERYPNSSTQWDVYGQHFARNNSLLSIEFHVNTETTLNQWHSSGAPYSEGGFLVAWMSDLANATNNEIRAQRFSSNLSRFGGELLVGNVKYSTPQILGFENGDFIIAFENFLHKYSSNNSAIGSGINISSVGIEGRGFSQGTNIEALTGNRFLIVGGSCCSDGSRGGIYAQIFGEDLSRYGSTFLVNNYTQLGQEWPCVATLSDGGFVIAWQSDGQDGDSWGIYGQRFDFNGSKIGSEFRINSYTANVQERPRCLGLDDGGFIVVWKSDGQNQNASGIYGQRYDAMGNPIPLVVNQVPPSSTTSGTVQDTMITEVYANTTQPSSLQEYPLTTTSTLGFATPVIIEIVYGNSYSITQNGQTIGTITLSGGTGQFSSSNPNTIHIEIDPNYTLQDGDTLTLFTIPEGESFEWEGITLSDSECFNAEGEIVQSPNGDDSFDVIFNLDTQDCTLYTEGSKLHTLPLLTTGGLI